MRGLAICSLLAAWSPIVAASDSQCPETPHVTCRFEPFYAEYEFSPRSFETRAGELKEAGWYIPSAEGFRGSCLVVTPTFAAVGSGTADASFRFKASFGGYIRDIRDLNEMLAFELRLSYKDPEGVTKSFYQPVKVAELGMIRRIGHGEPGQGDFYYVSTGEYIRKTVEDAAFTTDATAIQAKLCALFPGVDVTLHSAKIEIWNH